MVSTAHLWSHHQSSSIYVWMCKTSSHHQLKNRIPPEITRSQLQCQEEHMSSSVTELFVPFVKCWVINSLGTNKALKSRWERISKRAFEWYALVCPTEDGSDTRRVDFINTDQIWSDKLNCGFLRHRADGLLIYNICVDNNIDTIHIRIYLLHLKPRNQRVTYFISAPWHQILQAPPAPPPPPPSALALSTNLRW